MTSKIVVVTGGGDVTWEEQDEIVVNDNIAAYYPLIIVPGQTDHLYAIINAAQIPVDSTILGIQTKIKRRARAGLNRCRDVTVDFLNGVTPISDNKPNAVDYPSDTTYRTDTYGSSIDMWGTSLTAADLNSGNIKLRFQCERYGGFATTFFDVDYMEIEIFYEGGITPSELNVYGPQIQVI